MQYIDALNAVLWHGFFIFKCNIKLHHKNIYIKNIQLNNKLYNGTLVEIKNENRRRDVMKKLIRKLEDLMVAVTFAEAGEYDEAVRKAGDQAEVTHSLDAFKTTALESARK